MTIDSFVLPRGIYTPIPTYFKKDYSLDLETQVEHTKFLHNAGINGLVVAGSMGESTHLTREERLSLFRTLRQAVPDPNFKIIAGAPSGPVEEIREEMRLAREAGADFSILLVPGYFGPNLISQEGIIEYFELVSKDSPLPIIIYNYPGNCNGVDIKPETFEVLGKLPAIVAVKLTHFNLATYTLLGQNTDLIETYNFRPFTGLGQVLIPSLSVGVFGAIDGLSGMFPKSMLKILELYDAGELQKAQKIQYLVTKVDEMVTALNVVGVKYSLNKLYGYGETLTGRPPLSKPANLEVWKKYEIEFNELAKLEKSL
ncbi:BA75_01180T0 [Komagataella pastoris]|uniref:BA75_01180T0 n=1 Tax=Komagataella pastoris TaxID=4922 RepID=A0A1B2J9B4_PICPA|nr:BA75_01180T0 [Komagataella pastoris]